MSLKRRRTDPDTTTSKGEEEDENDGSNRRNSKIRKKRSCANAFIVISDSDGETQKEEDESQRRKNKLSTALSKLEAKRRIAQMTEEEQLELAVRMSEQEASQINYRQETEEELLKKAIAESLNSKPASKVTGKSKTSLKLAPKELKQTRQTDEEEDFNCSQTTCPDSQPLLQTCFQLSSGKSNILHDSRASSLSPKKKSASASLSGSCSPSPIRKSASQLLDRVSYASPVKKPGLQMSSHANDPSPVDFQQLDGASCVTPIKKPNSHLLDGASPLSPSREPCSQPLEEAGCSLRAIKPSTVSLNGTSCLFPERLDSASCASPVWRAGSSSLSRASSVSPMRKSASQPLSGVSCLLSPIRRPLSQPEGEARSWSVPVREPLSGSSYLSPFRKSSSQPQTEIEPSSPSRMCASDSPNGGTKSPVVILERLSQDILESSNIVLSLAGSPSSGALTDNSDFVPKSPLKHQHAMSPTFPRRPRCALQLAPCRLSNLVNSQGAVNKDGEKRPSDGAESSSGSSTPEHLINFEGDGVLDKVASQSTDLIKSTKCSGACNETLVNKETCQKVSCTVHYYWGVPFCPKGVDPCQYSKVILCQLEVYQKSLKQAQRQLLQKMQFGPPILPRPPSLRRRDRCRGDEKDEEIQEYTSGGLSPQEDPLSENSRESSVSLAAEESTAQAEDGPTTSYTKSRCVVQAFNGSGCHQDAMEVEPMEDIPNASAISCSNVLRRPESTGTHEDEEVTVCPETQPSLLSNSETEKTNPPSAENSSQSQSEREIFSEDNKMLEPQTAEIAPAPIVANMGPSMSDIEPNETDVEPTVAGVPCPLCGREFAPEQIEHHAADCDGNTGTPKKKQVGPVITRRQREMKRTAQDVETLISIADTGKRKATNVSPRALHLPGSGKCEKCYLCKELVPLREYKGHVENCLQAVDMENTKSPTLRSAKRNPVRGDGRLLSMLDRSEFISGAAESKIGSPGGRPQRLCTQETGDEEDQMTHAVAEPNSPDDFSSPLPFSNSPIRSFVSISEATDCLVDFKKQFNREPRRGRGRTQGRSSSRSQRNRGWRGKRR